MTRRVEEASPAVILPLGAAFMAVLDIAIVNVALPSIQNDLAQPSFDSGPPMSKPLTGRRIDDGRRRSTWGHS